MTKRYDEQDYDHYAERDEDRPARRDESEYERERYERNANGPTLRVSAKRYGAERADDSYNYGRGAGPRGSAYDRAEPPARYGRDYGRDAAGDYDRSDAGYGRERDYGRAYERERERNRDYERDFDRGSAYGGGYAARSARGYDYERGRRDYDYARDERSLRRPDERGEERGRVGKERGWWDRVSDEVASWFGDEEAERRRLRDEGQRGASHRGRGPRGYRRADERIRDDINDRLTDHPYLDATDIEVGVQSSEVTLTGAVESRQAKRLAEDIVDSVSGVTNVENRLRVNRSSFDTTATTTTDTSALPPASEPNTDTAASATAAGATSTGRAKPPIT